MIVGSGGCTDGQDEGYVSLKSPTASGSSGKVVRQEEKREMRIVEGVIERSVRTVRPCTLIFHLSVYIIVISMYTF